MGPKSDGTWFWVGVSQLVAIGGCRILGRSQGNRFGELSALELRHVDVDRSELRVDQAPYYAKGAGARLRPPKTESAHRAVVVPAQITHRFCEHNELFVNDMRPKSLDFTLLRGSPLLNRTFSPYWHRALRDPRPRHRRCDRSKDAATVSSAHDGLSLISLDC
jgi:hypothetical protein